jgi:hypothetical protein
MNISTTSLSGGRMDLVDTKVEVQYLTEVSAWKGFPERLTQRSFERKR